jgi:hypothetical protein
MAISFKVVKEDRQINSYISRPDPIATPYEEGQKGSPL